jgi:hypothetical protein
MKKNLIASILLVFSTCWSMNLNAQGEEQTDVVLVEYMKVKPGMMDNYKKCEKVWKKIHELRVKEGAITGWELNEVLFPSGTSAEYDFLTVTHYKNWGAMNEEGIKNWVSYFKTLNKEEQKIADSTEMYRDLVKREIWEAPVRLEPKEGSMPKYFVENFMNIKEGKWEEWMNMEVDFAMPVHKKNIEKGNLGGWLLTNMLLPRGAELPYQASTVDIYNTWEDMAKDQGAAWKEVYPEMDWGKIDKKVNSSRTIVRSEVREVIYFVN